MSSIFRVKKCAEEETIITARCYISEDGTLLPLKYEINFSSNEVNGA
jgi:hypothetical protein